MKTIERLIRKNATEAGKWETTHYLSLKQARDANPGEYPNHFRIATGERVLVTHVSGYPVIHKTRFTELGYWHNAGKGFSFWQCVDLTGDKPAQIGTQYATKAELLANLEAYATEYGCDNANPKVNPVRHEESNAGGYYNLHLWNEYLAAKSRWEFAHQEHAFCPLPIPRETIKELHESREAMGRLLHLLRQTPEHKAAFGW